MVIVGVSGVLLEMQRGVYMRSDADVLGFAVRWIKASRRLLLSMRKWLSRKLYAPAFSNIRYEEKSYHWSVIFTLILPNYPYLHCPNVFIKMMISGQANSW